MLLSALLAPGSAPAAGDANQSSCPPSTESSSGFRASLPDCRAYELVTQADSADLLNIQETFGFPDHFLFASFLPTREEGTGEGLPEQFLATRTAQGWQQTPLSVPQGEGPTAPQTFDTGGVMFTGDFSDALLMEPFQNALESPRLDETTGTMVYDLSLGSGATSTVSLPDSGTLTQSTLEFPVVYRESGQGATNGWGGFLAGASEDGSRIFFSTSARLATAPGTPQDTHQTSAEVYERTSGHTYLVGVLPDGEVPECGAEVGQSDLSTAGRGANQFYAYRAIAPNGSNVVFRTPGEDPEGVTCTEAETGVFLRDVLDGTTVKLPGDRYAGRAATQPGEEEKIFTVERAAGKIFEYHVATEQTVEIASGARGLLAYSANAARVYYLGAESGIYLYEEGAPAPKLVPGTQQGGYGEALSVASAIYGSFIATEQPTGSSRAAEDAPAVTGDAGDLLFLSPNQLTPYENCVEVEVCHVQAYLYDAHTEQVTCVSCGRNAPPEGNASFLPNLGGPGESADWVPPASPLIDSKPAEGGREAVKRVVFQSTEGLVPRDTNGTWDVYEWEQEETEGCSRASLGLPSLTDTQNYSEADHGCLYLLSSGAGRELEEGGDPERKEGGSHLLGASEGLTDVYVETDQAMIGAPDLDNVAHVYDVRERGGFPSTATAPPGCEPGLCRPEGEGLPVFGAPASTTLTGAENLEPSTTKPTSKPKLTRKQQLARALKACKRLKSKHKRVACEHTARAKYGAKVRRGAHHRRKGGSK
ncbi:MAG TPA: hypothetical protein VHT25_13750 [Solirubrobacteraceae bacterium]|nr:hypothetical protein [Solirubrobacteraceae bacterium]